MEAEARTGGGSSAPPKVFPVVCMVSILFLSGLPRAGCYQIYDLKMTRRAAFNMTDDIRQLQSFPHSFSLPGSAFALMSTNATDTSVLVIHGDSAFSVASRLSLPGEGLLLRMPGPNTFQSYVTAVLECRQKGIFYLRYTLGGVHEGTSTSGLYSHSRQEDILAMPSLCYLSNDHTVTTVSCIDGSTYSKIGTPLTCGYLSTIEGKYAQYLVGWSPSGGGTLCVLSLGNPLLPQGVQYIENTAWQRVLQHPERANTFYMVDAQGMSVAYLVETPTEVSFQATERVAFPSGAGGALLRAVVGTFFVAVLVEGAPFQVYDVSDAHNPTRIMGDALASDIAMDGDVVAVVTREGGASSVISYTVERLGVVGHTLNPYVTVLGTGVPETESPTSVAPNTSVPLHTPETWVPDTPAPTGVPHILPTPVPPTLAPYTLVPTPLPHMAIPTDVPSVPQTAVPTDVPSGSWTAEPTGMPTVLQTAGPTDVPFSDTPGPVNETVSPLTPMPQGSVVPETEVPSNTSAPETPVPMTPHPAPVKIEEQCVTDVPDRPGVHLISQSDEDAAELRTKISSDMGVSCGCAGVRVQQRREQGLPMLGVEAVAGCPAMDEADDVTDREGVRVMLRMTLSQLCSAEDVQAAAALPADNIIAAAEVNTVLQPIKGKPPVLDGPTRTINLLAEGVSGVRGVDSSGALAGSVREVMLNRLGGGLVQLAGCNVVQTEVHAAGPATRCRVTVSATPTPSASASVTAPQLAAALGFSETRLYDLFTDQKGQTRFTLRDAVGDTSGENLCAVVRSKLVNGTGLAFKEAVPSQPPVLKRFQLCQRSQSSRPPLYGNVHDLGRELQVPASAIRNIVSLAEVRECHVLREVEVAMYGDVAAQTGNWPYAVLQEDTVNAPRRFFKGKVIASNGPMSLTAVDLAAVLRVLEERVYVHENAEFAFETTAPIASTTAAAAELVKQGLVARQYANIRNVLLQEADPSEAFLIDLCRNIDHHHALVLRKPVCNSCPPVLAPITNSPRAAPSDDAADASTVATTLIIALAMVAAAVIAAVVFLRRHKPVKFGDLVNDLDEDTYEEGRDDSI